MVYYFTSTVVDPPAYIYVGKDKFESESRILCPMPPGMCTNYVLTG